MKSILLIMPYGSVGGMERLALTFYNHYKSKGYNVKAVKLINLESDIINFGEDEFSLSKIDFFQMSIVKRIFFYLLAPYRLRKIIKKNNITHSISFGDMTNIFSSLTITKEFKIASIHALKSVEFSNKTLFNKIFKLGFKTTYKNFEKVVCISKAIKQDLIANCGYKFNNLKIIYNPHNTESIQQLSLEKISDSHEIDIFTKKTVLFLGRLSLQKSPWHLLNAFKLLLDKDEDINLVFIGDGEQRIIDVLERNIAHFNIESKVFFLGRKKNPYKYIKAANVLALSSYYEGTPNVIVESICVGTPIVSTNCTGGIIELMSDEMKIQEDENILTESGIITPNVFKGELAIPNTFEQFTKEEICIANGLLRILSSNNFKDNLINKKQKLLSKFDLNLVARNYLQK